MANTDRLCADRRIGDLIMILPIGSVIEYLDLCVKFWDEKHSHCRMEDAARQG
ncbi:MAG: hypothetical protein ABI481_05860 [Pyrinomonadaceae bacterium]